MRIGEEAHLDGEVLKSRHGHLGALARNLEAFTSDRRADERRVRR